jgi:hypothetical protein
MKSIPFLHTRVAEQETARHVEQHPSTCAAVDETLDGLGSELQQSGRRLRWPPKSQSFGEGATDVVEAVERVVLLLDCGADHFGSSPRQVVYGRRVRRAYPRPRRDVLEDGDGSER